MKKNIAKLLVLVIAISLFSGCANKNKIGDELKTIKLWSGYCMIAEDELEMEKSEWILTKLVDKYNEIQDDIRVEFSYFDDIDDALIEGLSQNQDFFSMLLSNDEMKRQVLGIFSGEIYKSLRESL